MSNIFNNNINNLTERISSLDTGAMLPFLPLGLALRRGSALSQGGANH